MVVGIPAVQEPVGVNREIVVQGSNGFLAASEQRRETALELLLADPGQRSVLGKVGRALVERSHSTIVDAACLAGILREATG